MNSHLKLHVLSMFLIALFSVVAYHNIFANAFVWDDHIYILDNLIVQDPGNFISLFSSPSHGSLYRPLREANKMLVIAVFGTSPLGHHLNALFWHVLASLLVYALAYQILERRLAAFFAASLFAVHPIHTDRVANMTAGYDLLGIVLLLAAFLCYVLARKHGKKHWLAAFLVFYTAGLFASEEALIIPFLIILYEVVYQNAKEDYKKTIAGHKKVYALLMLITALFVGLRYSITSSLGRGADYLAGTLYATMLTMTKVMVHYIYLLVIPYPLTLEYGVPIETTFSFKVVVSLLLLAALVYLWVIMLKKNTAETKVIAFGIGWFFIAMLPFYNILPLFTLLAERYLYVASFAFTLLLGWLLAKQFRKHKIVVLLIFLVLVSVYTAIAVNRNAEWKDGLTLWQRTVETMPESSRAHDNLGQVYQETGEIELAFASYNKALALDPNNHFAHNNAGTILAMTGDYNASIPAFLKAIELNPSYAEAYDNIGLTHHHLGNNDKALYAIQKAIELDPNFYKAYNDMGTVYASGKEYAKAESAFREALLLKPDYTVAQQNLKLLMQLESAS